MDLSAFFDGAPRQIVPARLHGPAGPSGLQGLDSADCFDQQSLAPVSYSRHCCRRTFDASEKVKPYQDGQYQKNQWHGRYERPSQEVHDKDEEETEGRIRNQEYCERTHISAHCLVTAHLGRERADVTGELI
ncbi:hypothetical protein D9M69_570220 [compost metagenome]